MSFRIFKRTPLNKKGRSKGTYVAFHRHRGTASFSSEAAQKMKIVSGNIAEIFIYVNDENPSLIGFGPGDPTQTEDVYPLRRSKGGSNYYISVTDFIRSQELDISDSPKFPAEMRFVPDQGRELLIINRNDKMTSSSTTTTKDASARKEEQPSLFPKDDVGADAQTENNDERLERILDRLEQEGQKMDAEQRMRLKQTLKEAQLFPKFSSNT